MGRTYRNPPALTKQETDLIRKGRAIDAVHHYSKRTGAGFATASRAIKAWRRKHRPRRRRPKTIESEAAADIRRMNRALNRWLRRFLSD